MPRALSIYSIVFCLAVMLCARLSAQTAGVAANFGIDSTCYSGIPDINTDDWFQGLSGDGVLDESNTAFYYNQLSTNQNISFDVDLDVPKYSRPNGYILYDAKFIRDQIKLSGSNGDGTTFTGAKNGQNPEDWSPSGSGNVSGANDIVDGYIHMRRDGDSIDDNLWMMMGITTLETNGDHFFDFEMYFSDLTFTGTEFINAGPDEGHNSWDFDGSGEIIQTGDLSVGFAVSGGGITNFEVRIWTSRWNYNNTTPAQFSWGTEFDGAKNNSIYGYASIVVSSADFFAVTNGSATPAPPWGTHVAGAAFSTSYPANYFAEVAVNLSAIGLNNFLSLPGVNPCLSPFAKVMAKSRSSQSFTSALGDFTNPVEFSANSLIDSTGAEIADLYSCGAPSTLVPANPVIGAYYEWTTTDGLFDNGTQTSVGDTAFATQPGTYTLSSAPLAECVRGESTVEIDAHPCAVEDAYTVLQNETAIPLDVLFNDYDLDNDIDRLSLGRINVLNPINGGAIAINDTIYYTPSSYFIGLDSFQYYICDITGQCDTTMVTMNVELDPNNCNAGCEEVYRFNWFDGVDGFQWPITNGESSLTRTYTLTGAAGDVEVDITIDNSDGQNIDFANCGTTGNHFYSATCDDPNSSVDCDGDPLTTDGQFSYGCDFLTFGITSENSSQQTSFTFDFQYPTRICDLLIGDIDYQGDDATYGSWQDEIDIVASNGATPIAINVISGSEVIVTNNITPNVNIASVYQAGTDGNLSPDDPAGQAAISTVAPITSFTIIYRNGPLDDGFSDDHAIRISSFDVCPTSNVCQTALTNPHIMYFRRN